MVRFLPVPKLFVCFVGVYFTEGKENLYREGEVKNISGLKVVKSKLSLFFVNKTVCVRRCTEFM